MVKIVETLQQMHLNLRTLYIAFFALLNLIFHDGYFRVSCNLNLVKYITSCMVNALDMSDYVTYQ
jgi:hypothetical protein